MKERLEQIFQNLNQKIMRMGRFKLYGMVYFLCMFVVLYVTSTSMKLIQTQLMINHIKAKGINYDAFRELMIDEEAIQRAQRNIRVLTRKHPELKKSILADEFSYLAVSMLSKDYDLVNHQPTDLVTFLRVIAQLADTEYFQELSDYYRIIFQDLKYFPIPKIQSGSRDISYSNTWHALRKYGGNRWHEGTDLMDPKNISGYFPVVSMTDGVVENIGWLEQGGNRVGIRSASGAYFYYAHLHSYAPNLKEGDAVIAGQLLGFMGDSGYGPPGTVGQFDVHLHVGIYIPSTIGEISVNPYWILQMLEEHRTFYFYE
jgi:murein DD-endopeptidase MepM/ murein hydrolase activator NlpD